MRRFFFCCFFSLYVLMKSEKIDMSTLSSILVVICLSTVVVI